MTTRGSHVTHDDPQRREKKCPAICVRGFALLVLKIKRHLYFMKGGFMGVRLLGSQSAVID